MRTEETECVMSPCAQAGVWKNARELGDLEGKRGNKMKIRQMSCAHEALGVI